MKQIIFLIGKFCSYLFPQRLCGIIKSITTRFFTGYKARYFNTLGKGSTLGNHTTYIGEQYISIGVESHIGDYGRLTAYLYYPKTEQHFTPQIIIRDHCSIGDQCHITAINSITIGNGVLTGPRVLITDNAHGTTDITDTDIAPRHRELTSTGPIVIEDNVWIGEGAMILPNVHIGEHAIIAANSVVTKDIPAYSIAAGVPAKIIKHIK